MPPARPRRRSRRPLAPTLLALAAAGATACGGSERATGPASSQFDLTRVLGAMSQSAEYTGATAADPRVATSIPSLSGMVAQLGRPTCAWSAAAQAFECAPQTWNGFTLTHRYTPFDAEGRPLSAPTAATTASVRTVSTLAGTSTQALPNGQTSTVTIDQSHDATVSGLLTASRVIDGVRTARTQWALPTAVPAGTPIRLESGVQRTTQTTRGLTLPSSPPGLPTAGSVTTVTTDDAGGQRITSELTFMGGGTVMSVLTFPNGMTQRCTLNLAGGMNTPPQCTGG